MISKIRAAINFRHGPYGGSRQEQDCFIRPSHDQYLPSLVLLSGWSESLPQLMQEVDLWMVGGDGDVRAVIVLIWQTLSNQKKDSHHHHHHQAIVTGTAELYTLGTNKSATDRRRPVLCQRECVFPAPSSEKAQAQAFNLTRRMLFGDMKFSGKDADEILLPLSVESLREKARVALDVMGLEPAQPVMVGD